MKRQLDGISSRVQILVEQPENGHKPAVAVHTVPEEGKSVFESNSPYVSTRCGSLRYNLLL